MSYSKVSHLFVARDDDVRALGFVQNIVVGLRAHPTRKEIPPPIQMVEIHCLMQQIPEDVRIESRLSGCVGERRQKETEGLGLPRILSASD